MKQDKIKLTESQLKGVITESVKKILNEISLSSIKSGEEKTNGYWRTGDYDWHDPEAWRDIVDYDDAFEAIEKLSLIFNEFAKSYHGSNNGAANNFLVALENMKKFLERKGEQHKNFAKGIEGKEKELANEIAQKAAAVGVEVDPNKRWTDMLDDVMNADEKARPEDEFGWERSGIWDKFVKSLSSDAFNSLDREGFISQHNGIYTW